MAETSIEATASPEQSENSTTTTTLRNEPPPPPAPNGGFEAWTQAAAGHLVIFNCWGYLTSFGLFQSHYTTTLHASPSAISWIGSVQIFLIYSVGAFSGRALDAGHFRATVTLGSLLQVLGVFTTSACTTYWQLFLAQGVCKGLGDGLVFCPTIALIATYFTTNRSAAIGIAASGGATGGIVFPLIAQQLLPRVGFAWTVRTMAFVILVNAAVSLSLARTRPLPPRTAGPLVEWTAFRDPAYSLFCAGMFFNLWAVFFAYFYLPTFALSTLSPLPSPTTSLTLLLTLNALGLPARLAANALADSFGPLLTLAPCTLACAALCFAWTAVATLPTLYAWTALYGIFGGAVQSLFPAASASLAPDVGRVGTWTGMCFLGVAGACLTGPVVGGALVEGPSFVRAQVWAGSALVVGSAGVGAAWWWGRRKGV